MKKILLFLFFVSMAFVVNAQVLRPSGLPTTNSPSRYDVTGYQRDSAFLYVLRDSFPAKYPSVIYHPNGNLYKTEGGVGAYWTLITDTTWLSNRIDLKLSIADTAAMLSNYLHKTDTAGMLQPYAKYSDTSNMLTPYHQSFYTATFDTTTRILTMYPIAGTVPTILSIPRGGSISGISSLTPYRVPGSDVQYLIADNGDVPGFTLKTADSATIMHFSDTATMLAPYAHSQAVVKYYDTSAMLSKYVRYTDTANIVANRLKISDTATMLANRLKISDTATMLGGYKTYYPRTAISGGTGITYDPTTGVISNGSPSSGGTVTIVSAGVGMNFTTITTTGSVNADTLVLATRLHVDSVAMRKLNLTDTSTMLSSRLKISDTATMLRNHATYAETLSGKNISGSTNNLSNIGNSSLINSTISGIPLGSNLSALTNGFGITTLSYNGSTAKVVTVDTSSSGVATWALLKKKIDSVSAIGGGSVSSVGLVLPSFITVSGSPITTSGTLTGTLANQTANKVFASPTTGSAAQPTFRALVAADLPDSYLPISDTASMLSPYAHFQAVVKYYDTSNMLNDYHKYKIAAWGDSFTDYGAAYWQDSLSYWQGVLMYNGGVAGEDAPAIRARMVDSVYMHTWPTIIWAGRNGFTDTTAVLSNIAVMVDSLRANRNERFLVVSILNPVGAPIGTGDYNLIIYLNNRLKNLYPNNYVELRRYLVLKYNPNDSTDVVDFTNDVIPSSLRVDGTHLNPLGNYWVAVRFDQFFSTLTGNPQQWFQNVVSGGFQAKGNFQRDATAPGTEMFYDTVAKRGYIDVYDATIPAYQGLNIRTADLNIITDGGPITADSHVTLSDQLTVMKSATVTDSISSAKILASALPEFTTGTRYYMFYDAADNGQLKYKTEDSVKAYLGLSQYMVKSDTVGSGYTSYWKFYDSLDAVQSRIQTKQPLLSSGISGYLPKFTGSSTLDTSIITTIGGRVGIKQPSPQSGLDINNAIDGMPANSGSDARGGVRVTNSGNIGLDIGVHSVGKGWIQVSDIGNYASNFPLFLQPNGSNVNIGYTVDQGNKLSVNGNVSAMHIIGNSGSLSSTGLGTNVSSISISGTDLGMTVTVVTSGAVSGTIGTVNFNTAFGANPHVVISCADITTGGATSSLAANATGTGTFIIAGIISGAGTYVYNVIAIQ